MLDHGFSPDKWLAFLDGTLAEAERRPMLEHAQSCESCAALLAGFSNWQQLLEAEGAESRERLRQSDERVERLTARILGQLHEPALAGDELVAEALDTVRSVLVPICGSRAAETSMRKAAAHSPALDLSRVSLCNWAEFVSSLSAQIASYCGLAPARLVAAAAPRLQEVRLS